MSKQTKKPKDCVFPDCFNCPYEDCITSMHLYDSTSRYIESVAREQKREYEEVELEKWRKKRGRKKNVHKKNNRK